LDVVRHSPEVSVQVANANVTPGEGMRIASSRAAEESGDYVEADVHGFVSECGGGRFVEHQPPLPHLRQVQQFRGSIASIPSKPTQPSRKSQV